MKTIRLPMWVYSFKWGVAAFLLLTHIMGLLVAPWYLAAVRFSWATIALAVVMFVLTGLSGITAGYHRLFTHGAYKAHPAVRLWFAVFGAAALEGHIQEWCWNHRDHHRFTDDLEKDPYCFPKGFLYAHIWWMLWKRTNLWWRKESDIGDLRRDPVVQWQKRHYAWVAPLTCFGLPTGIAWLGWGDPLGGFLVAGWLRLVVLYHATWSVNSFAHWVGDQPFPTNISPRNSWWVALITFGEGYHANHHKYETEYRNAFRWWQYDPGKWLIWLLARLGLAWDLTKNA